MNERYQGKRFLSLLVAMIALIIGYFAGHPDTFGAYSTTIGVLYGAYLAGQSATDYQKAKNGG